MLIFNMISTNQVLHMYMGGHMALNQSLQGIMENIYGNGKEIFEMPKTINFEKRNFPSFVVQVKRYF